MKRYQAYKVFQKGTLIQSWAELFSITNPKKRKFGMKSGYSNLYVLDENYYLIYVSDEKIYLAPSKKLVREKQVGENSYIGKAILFYEQRLFPNSLVGEGLV